MQCLWKVPPSLVNIVPVVAVFSSMIPQYRSLTNLGNYSLCHRRHEINKKCNNYCLSALCHRQLNTARNMLARQLRRVGYCSLFPDDLSISSYRSRPNERQGSSGQTSLVAATSQSVRVARSLATGFQARQPHLHTCLSAQVSRRETRVHAGRWHAGHSLRHIRCSKKHLQPEPHYLNIQKNCEPCAG